MFKEVYLAVQFLKFRFGNHSLIKIETAKEVIINVSADNQKNVLYSSLQQSTSVSVLIFFFAIVDASAEKSVKCEVIQSFMLLTYLEIIQTCLTGKVKQQAKGNAEESGPQQFNDVMLFLLSSL